MPGLALGKVLMLVSIYSGMGRGEWNVYLRYYYQDTLSRSLLFHF